MEAHQERVDDSDPHCHEWSGFPELRIDPKDDPYAQTPTMWSATSQHFLAVAMVASGAGNVKQLSERLRAAQRAIETRLTDARQAGAAAVLSGWCLSPVTELGLSAYALSLSSIAEGFQPHEIYSAIAAWLLLQGHSAFMRCDQEHALRCESQALVCMAAAFGEGGRTVIAQDEKDRRTKVARSNATAGHAEHRRRKEQLMAEYRAATWPSKTVAAETLASRHHFSVTTIRKLLQGL